MSQATKSTALTLRQASREFQVPLSTLHNWLKAGHLTLVKPAETRGQSLLVSAASVLRALDTYRPYRQGSQIIRGTAHELQANQGATTRKVEATQRSPAVYPTAASPPSQDLPSDYLSTRELFQEFQAYNAPLSYRTRETYETYLADFLERFPTLPLDPGPVSRFLAEKPYSDFHQFNRFRALRAFYHWLYEQKDLVNPFYPRRRVRSISKPKTLPRFLERDQLSQVIAQAENFPEKVMLELFATAAIRAGELCSLEKAWVFPTYIEVEGKTGRRRVDILPFVYDDLKTLAASHPGRTVFVDRKGQPMSPSGAYQRVQKCMLKAGITGKKLGPHTLRHSFGHIYQKEKGDLVALQHMLGHSRVETTQIYASLSQGDITQKYLDFDPGRMVPGRG
jgi:integrase